MTVPGQPFIDCQWDHKEKKENVKLTNHKDDNELLNEPSK